MNAEETWLCNACGGTVYRGVRHVCAPSGNAERMGRLVEALRVERARLDTLAKLRPGELFDALSDPRGLRVVLDRLIAERLELASTEARTDRQASIPGPSGASEGTR